MFAKVKAWQNGFGSPPISPTSPKSDVGEIDTRAPIKSVRAAASLFGDVVSPKERPIVTRKTTKAEEQQILEKETQHHMILRELDNYKEKLRTIDSAKAQASKDLNRANANLQELTNMLEALSESKQSFIQETDDAIRRVKELEELKSVKPQLGNEEWSLDMDSEHNGYKASAGQLISSKQELTVLRQDIDATLEAKLLSFQEYDDAQQATIANLDRQSLLSKEVDALRETLDQVRVASVKAEEERMRLITEKEIYVLLQKSTMEDVEMEIERLRNECGGSIENMMEKLEEANGAIELLKEQLNNVRISDLESLEEAKSELDFNKRELERIGEEKVSIQESLEVMRQKFTDVRRTRLQSMERAMELELKLEEMQKCLESKKAELDEAIYEESKSLSLWDEMRLDLSKRIGEAEKDRNEAEGVTREVESLRREAEVENLSALEADEKLEAALKEVQVALAAEKLADEKIHDSPRNDSIEVESESKGQGSLRKIRLSVKEFEAMNQKMETCKIEADEKVAILKDQREVTTASADEVSLKVAKMRRENEEMESEIEEVSKRAAMAEDAKKMVEVELEKLRSEEGDVSSLDV